MIKLTKQVNALKGIRNRLQERIDKLEEKQLKIELPANEHEREMTAEEQDRYDRLQDALDELIDEKVSIECALRYLQEYAEE